MTDATKQDAASNEERSFGLPEGREASEITFIRPAKLSEAGFLGVILEGEYVGSLPNPHNSEKLDFKFKLDDGSISLINGAGNLGYKMQYINVGDYVQVEYEGKQEMTKGDYKGKQAHNFEVRTAE